MGDDWLIVGVILLGLLLGPAGPASANERVEDLSLPGGAEQRVLVAAPDTPHGALVMLPGGAGMIGIGHDGTLAHGDNFVVRTRRLWTSRGYAVLIPDAISHQSLRGTRRSESYAAVIGTLVQLAHKQTSGPVFLLGTSQGSIAALNGASHLTRDQIAGVILTESVSQMGGSGETVFDADPKRVSVPALVVANEADLCRVSPPTDADRIAAALSNSPSVQVLHVAGGTRRSEDCGSLSPHGYYGIEADVVARIATWMGEVAPP